MQSKSTTKELHKPIACKNLQFYKPCSVVRNGCKARWPVDHTITQNGNVLHQPDSYSAVANVSEVSMEAAAVNCQPWQKVM